MGHRRLAFCVSETGGWKRKRMDPLAPEAPPLNLACEASETHDLAWHSPPSPCPRQWPGRVGAPARFAQV